ncbi:hypothetical protein NKR23_g1812 [Pleurostoma richardsiae]|uniref:Cytochrome b mRNA-processing protein 4 n=1 Tax=Pleurostoma richardsiae TaxID=41990 RepID=A0AA38RPB8_9PEZI|nr:hypothetical protein NKR23_g1812 [Pleurostoma richardsiae]
MARGKTNWLLWGKMLIGGAVLCVGGPALTVWLRPTDEELFMKYNPELQKKSLENRFEKQKDFDDFVNKLKEYSKSDKPIWFVQAEEARAQQEAKRQQTIKLVDEERARREAMRKEAGLPAKTDG